jgi:hypothetical protein
MNLLTLALRNIKLNRKKYMMYVFSMGFSIFTVYTFMALMQNEYVLLAFRYDSRYRMVLTSFGIIILVFVLFFLISSNNSFIRARKKELSTYACSECQITGSAAAFLETILVGAATLPSGSEPEFSFQSDGDALLDLCLPAFGGYFLHHRSHLDPHYGAVVSGDFLPDGAFRTESGNHLNWLICSRRQNGGREKQRLRAGSDPVAAAHRSRVFPCMQ